mgnify:CR=1 FL=1
MHTAMPADKKDPYIRLLVREAIAPLRASASDAAEMASQLLFGETCMRLQDQGNWLQVRRDFDGYEGWLDAKQVEAAPPDFSPSTDFCFVLSGSLILPDDTLMRLPLGTRLPKAALTGRFTWGGLTYQAGPDLKLTEVRPREHLVKTATLFLNLPYLWGGLSGWGLDCSGLVQTAAAMCGLSLPRDSSQQAEVGEAIAWGQQQAGDLAFLGKPGQNRITHVGILQDPHSIVHASGKVRLDPFDSTGITHSHSHHVTHHLLTMRRC